MRDLFNTNPFGRYDMGRFAAPAFATPVKMGCDLHNLPYELPEEDHTEEIDVKTLACKKCAKKHRRTNGRLGSSRLGFPRMGDDLLDGAKSVFESLLGTFADIVKGVPPAAAGVYQARLKACQDMVGANPNTGTYIAAGGCLRDLYRDIESGKGAAAPALLPPLQPQPSGFPIVPVALAAVAGLGLIYYFTTIK